MRQISIVLISLFLTLEALTQCNTLSLNLVSGQSYCLGQEAIIHAEIDNLSANNLVASFDWIAPNGNMLNYHGADLHLYNMSLAEEGVYTVEAEIMGCPNSLTAQVPLNVLPNFSLDAGAITNVCQQEDIVLQINLSGAENLPIAYSWQGPNGFSSTLANPSIFQATSAESGVYTISAEIGSCVLQDALMVQVLSASVIEAQPSFQSVCSGGMVTPLSVLTQNDFSVPSFQWSSGLTPNLSDGQSMIGEASTTIQPQNVVPGTTYYQVQVSYASPGCTDPLAVNFNSNSNVNDGSCLFNVLGCTDPTAINFNGGANQDNGSCSYAIYGCTDPMAENDDVLATIDDGSCWYLILGCTDNTAYNYDYNANQDDGSCIPFIYGCTNTGATNYSVSANTDDGSCIVPGCINGNADNFNQSATQDDGSCIFLGCMQMGAINFDPNANMEDGSCLFPSYGCTDPTAPNFVVWANIDDGSCIYYGCTDWTAFNYDINANTNDGSCIPVITGCIDPNATNFDPSANTDDGSCYLAGCTNPIADNYNGSATVEDGSCLITGCMDPGAVNFQPLANVSGICDYLGCTDPTADNYNPSATINQGCIYSGCTNPAALNYNAQANSDDGSCQVEGCMDANASNFNSTANIDVPASCEYLGCIDPVALNYNPNALVDDGSCIYIIPGCTDPSAFNYSPSATQDDGSCVPVVIGCTNNQAVNYDPAANTDNGSCQIFGCTNVQAINYNSQANNDDGSCIIPGCMDPSATNFNPQANLDNGTCDYTVPGCTDPLAGNYNSAANTDDGSCLPFGCNDPTAYNYIGPAVDNGTCEYLGCMNPLALNYNPIFTINDAASCIFPTPGCMDVNADNYSSSANVSDPTACLYLGCTNPNAMNYDPQANQNDGSCVPFIYGCTDPTAFNYNIYANTDDGSCVATVLGCTNSTSFNYNASANVDDGSCTPFTYGCMDPVALNYNPSANVDNGNCVMPFPGCTDPTAFNFNSNANVDDGSCIPIVLGCTNAIALNYNPAANVDDGSCLYNVTGCYQLLSGIYQVDIVADPQILVEPITSQTICEGGTPLSPIDFQLSSSGLSYTTTWYYSLNGVDVVTASTNGNSFSPSQVFTDLGSHFFWGEINFGSSGCDALQTASSEVLVVTDPTIQLATSPTIDICTSGISSPIEMIISGGVEPGFFEWYQSNTPISSGNLIAGQIQSIFLPDASSIGSNYYYATYTQSTSGCEAISPITAFNVVSQPTITGHPLALQEVCEGGLLQTLVTDFVGGVGNADVQWYIGSNSSFTSGSSIIGANVTSFDPPSQLVGSNYYFCEISFPIESGCQNQISNPAAVSIYADPILVSSTTSMETICIGGEANSDFQLDYFGGVGTPIYQWYQENSLGQPSTAILGANGDTYSAGVFTSEGSFVFNGMVSFDVSGCDALIGPVHEIVVLPDPQLSSIATTQQTQCQGSDVQTPMGVSVSGYQGMPQYQWWANTTNSNIGGTLLPGETLSEYLAPTGSLGSQYYYCEVTNVGLNGNMNTGCTSVSSVFSIEVVSPAALTGINLSQELCEGESALALTNTYSGGYGQLGVQWYSNTTPTALGGTAITGATTLDYLPSTTQEGTVYYYMELTQQGGGCPVVSGPVHEVEVHGYPVFTVDYEPSICFGETTDLVLDFSVPGNYQFNLSGPNGLQTYNNYTSGAAVALSPSQDAYYQIEQIASVQSPQCSVSAPGLVSIEVHPLPVVTGTQASYCDGTMNGVLGVTLPGPINQYGVLWQTDVTLGFAPNNPGQQQQTVGLLTGVISSQTRSYTVEVTENSTGCSSSVQSTVTVNPNPTAMFTAPSSVCVNSSVALVNNSVSNTTNAWYWDGQLVSNVSQPNNINESTAGNHTLQLVVENVLGCVNDFTQNVDVVDFPTAHFSANVVSGCSPLWVQFDNQSIASASVYLWNLGPDTLSWGSSSSTLEEIGDVFFLGNVQPSQYTISLTASNVCGSDDYESNITVYTQPDAAFQSNMDSLAGCSPFELSFNNLTQGIVSQYLWSYGDGQTSTAFEDIEHLFYSGNVDAFYPVSLTATNQCGSSTISDTVMVLSQVVEAFFTLPYNVGCAPFEVCFDDNSDGYGINAHSFFSGDGQMYSASSGCHVYQNPGTYQLIEQISNGCQTDQSSVEITVLPHPEVQLSVNTDEACTNELIVPLATADVPINYLWTIDQYDSLTVTYPSIVFDTPGLHWVTITATGVNNCSIKDSLSVLIHDVPQSAFNIPVNSVCSPFNACFNLTGSGDYFFWDFSEGNTATVANPCHVFTNVTMTPQEFPVQLISENTFGCKDSSIQEIVVLPQPNTQLLLPFNQTCLQEIIIEPQLQPSSALGFNWSLDGTLISNLVAPSILVQGVGPHTIDLTASNQYGCMGMDMEIVEISPIPVADFLLTSGSGCLPLNVSAANLSVGGDNYIWQVGEHQLSTFDLNFDLETAGDFNISLITSNVEGCSDTVVAVDTYSAYPVPYVEIDYSPEEIYDYQGAIRFYDVGNGSSMWYWEMGDGGQGYTNEYYHNYDFVGEYLVSLEGTNEFGCVARDSAMVSIKRDFEIFVPNAFTPKSYDGVNDYFKPIIRGKELILTYKFTITNRWGDLIFETNDVEAAWNGSMDNSPDYFVQNDTYIWLISVELLTESASKSMGGTVTIIR